MNTLILFFSYTGRTHYEARALSKQIDADVVSVHERKHRSSLNATFIGRHQAKKLASSPVDPIPIKLSDYDKIILMSPIWGGWPAPAFNSMVDMLPEGMEVELIFTSDSGRAKDLGVVKKHVEAHGARVTGMRVMKTIDLYKRDKLHEQRMKKERAAEEERASVSAAAEGAKKPEETK